MNIKEIEKKYLEDPNVCINPKCLGECLEGQFVDIDGSSGSQTVSCLSCGSSWTDCYTLTGIDKIEITNDNLDGN